MKIKDWPRTERPREKLIENGAQALSDAEILAILLRCGVRGTDAVTLARSLLRECGGLRALLEADLGSFSRLPGCGAAAFSTLKAALELGRRYVYSRLEHDGPLQNPSDASTYVVSRMKAYRREVFACLFLDLCVALINVELGHRGSIAAGIRRHQLHISTVTTFAST